MLDNVCKVVCHLASQPVKQYLVTERGRDQQMRRTKLKSIEKASDFAVEKLPMVGHALRKAELFIFHSS
jgi:hypothetical protein